MLMVKCECCGKVFRPDDMRVVRNVFFGSYNYVSEAQRIDAGYDVCPACCNKILDAIKTNFGMKPEEERGC